MSPEEELRQLRASVEQGQVSTRVLARLNELKSELDQGQVQ